MKNEIWSCDNCGAIIDDVAYTLTCYAEDVKKDPFGGVSLEVASQNTTQNLRRCIEKHLCKSCKDAKTDGIFII